MTSQFDERFGEYQGLQIEKQPVGHAGHVEPLFEGCAGGAVLGDLFRIGTFSLGRERAEWERRICPVGAVRLMV